MAARPKRESMQRRWFLYPLRCLFALLFLTRPAVADPMAITIGRSVVVLNGPWKFHVGDDPRWAEPDFDDANWEGVDLTPPPGAHDEDVGLTGYVPGWTARGHPGYAGYAWYRLRVSVAAAPGDALALDGPRAVDSAYQVFLNGHLLGGAGDFSRSVPVAYSIQPQMFPLMTSPETSSLESGVSVVVAFRVWVGSGVTAVPGAGGIHIAPALGEVHALEARYQVEWLETVRGYVVEVVEALAFVLLAVMACTLLAFDRSKAPYWWLIAGLLLVALQRANQAFYFWTQIESTRAFDLLISILVLPLLLGVWTMTWWSWLRLDRPAWMPRVIAGLTLLYMGAQWLGRSWFPLEFVRRFSAAAHAVSADGRLVFVGLMLFVAFRGVRQRGREAWLAVPAMALMAVGLFAPEISSLHVRSIWFPFGTGVSRTQFAYVGFDAALFVMLWHRLSIFAAAVRRLPER